MESSAAAARAATAVGAAGDAGHDGKVSPSFEPGGIFIEIADVFVVHIDVDEAAEVALVGEQVLFQVGELGGEVAKRLAYRGARHGHLIELRRELAESSGDEDFGHTESEPC